LLEDISKSFLEGRFKNIFKRKAWSIVRSQESLLKIKRSINGNIIF